MAFAQICKREKGNASCPFHPREKVVFECEECCLNSPGTLVCTECVGTSHHGHKIRKIKQLIPEKIKKIESHIKDMETSTIPEIVTEIQRAIEKMQENEKLFCSEIQKGKQHGEHLKKNIDSVTSANVSRLEYMLRENAQSIGEYKNKLDTLLKDLNAKKTEHGLAVKSISDVLVYDTEIDVSQTKKCQIPQIPMLKIAKFIPKEVRISRLFGNVEEFIWRDVDFSEQSCAAVANSTDEVGKNVLDIADKFEILSEFELPSAVPFCVSENNSAWICKEGYSEGMSVNPEKVVRLIDRDGTEKRKLNTGVVLADICVHPNTNELFCCVQSDNSVRLVYTESGTVLFKLFTSATRKLFNTKTKPLSMACTYDDMIVVASKNRLAVYTYTGKVVASNDKVMNPTHVAVCKLTGMVAVACEEYGVEVLDNNLQWVYTYKGGNAKAQKKYRFRSPSAVFDNNTNLIVGDAAKSEIHLLKGITGELIHTIQLHTFSFVHRLSLSDKVIWVECTSPNKMMCINMPDLLIHY